MDAFKRSLDNYLTGNDREWYDTCEDGHDWRYEADTAGTFRACIVCQKEEDLTKKEGEVSN